MINAIKKEDIYLALEEICKNENFEKSPRNIRLLRFLVEQSLNDNNIKEQVIGLELFDKNYDPLKNDGKVRVYIYNLRKKLEDYYRTDGKNDNVILSIQKGQYNVTFSTPKKGNIHSRTKNVIVIFVFLFVALAVITTFIINNINKPDDKYCWDTFLDKDTETICLVSDHKILWGELQNGNKGFVRIPNINTDKDLAFFLSQHKELDYQAVDFSFMTKMAPLASQQLTKWYCAHDKDFLIFPESELSYESLRTKNLIFFGQWKTLGKLKSLFIKNSKVFKTKENTITYNNGNTQIKYTSTIKENKRTDYTIVSFMKLNNDNEALFFSSNNDIGVVASIKKFTDKEWLGEFYKEIPDSSKYFNALFKVEGLGRTELNFELIQLEIINNENKNNIDN